MKYVSSFWQSYVPTSSGREIYWTPHLWHVCQKLHMFLSFRKTHRFELTTQISSFSSIQTFQSPYQKVPEPKCFWNRCLLFLAFWCWFMESLRQRRNLMLLKKKNGCRQTVTRINVSRLIPEHYVHFEKMKKKTFPFPQI